MYHIDDIMFACEKVKIQIRNKDIERYLICINSKITGLKLYTTDYTRYIYYSDGHIKKIESNTYDVVLYIVLMLNWIIIENFERYGVAKLEDITFEMCQDYLNWYAIYGANDRDDAPSLSAIKSVRGYITRFMFGMKRTGINLDMNNHWLLKESPKSSRRYKSYSYELDIVYDSSQSNKILRDIATEAIELQLTCARIYKPLMELPIAMQCYTGIREGATCNCRREDSIYGAGIITEHNAGRITGVSINLSRKHLLRSDRAPIGNPKRERIARVYPAFLDAFLDVYNRHLDITTDLKVEDTKPLFINERISRKTGCHMAMSVYSYKSNYKKLMKEYVMPIMRKSDNPRLRDFAQLLDQSRYGLHWFRHWFSVQLVLAGEEWQTLMEYRGDKSPESAITYVTNKKIFRDMYQKANAGLANDIIKYTIPKDEIDDEDL